MPITLLHTFAHHACPASISSPSSVTFDPKLCQAPYPLVPSEINDEKGKEQHSGAVLPWRKEFACFGNDGCHAPRELSWRWRGHFWVRSGCVYLLYASCLESWAEPGGAFGFGWVLGLWLINGLLGQWIDFSSLAITYIPTHCCHVLLESLGMEHRVWHLEPVSTSGPSWCQCCWQESVID